MRLIGLSALEPLGAALPRRCAADCEPDCDASGVEREPHRLEMLARLLARFGTEGGAEGVALL